MRIVDLEIIQNVEDKLFVVLPEDSKFWGGAASQEIFDASLLDAPFLVASLYPLNSNNVNHYLLIVDG